MVLTGHDGLVHEEDYWNQVDNYFNSSYFVEAVRRARQYEPNVNKLVVFAGACQSFYEKIMDAGANYASSPGRVKIHVLDPVFVIEKAAFIQDGDALPLEDVVSGTVAGASGIGGIQNLGTEGG